MFKFIITSIGVVFICCSFLSTGCISTPSHQPLKSKTDSLKNQNGRNDAWSFAGYGGGGATFYPAVSPFNPNVAFVACDMTGSFVTYNGGESWRMFNLRGPVDFFVFDPQDSNTVYANSVALFKSTDKGNTWNVLYPSAAEIKKIISKGDHASEIVVTTDSTKRDVLCLAIDPADSKKLFAVINIDSNIGFYSSANDGISWIKEKDLQERITNIFIHPLSPKNNRTVYLTATNSIQVKENSMWKVNTGPPGVKKITAFAAGFDSSKDKYVIYAISGKSYFNAEGDASGIYYTENGGSSWENRQEGLLRLCMKGARLPEWRSIATGASHPGTVYVSYNGLQVNDDTTCIGVAKSEDFGKTWSLAWKDRLAKKGYAVAENFKDGWINERFGPSWGENPFSIGVAPNDADICYTTDFGRVVKTIDGGKTWQQVYTTKKENEGWMSRGLEVTTGYDVVFDPFDTNHIFICNTDVGLMESKDGGESWKSATNNNGIPHEWINSTYWLAIDPAMKGRVWAVMSGTHDLPRPKMWRRNGIANYKGGVLLTENGGKSWTPVSKDIGEGAFTHILIDTSSDKKSRTLYACVFGKGVYKSIDGGKTWQQKNKGIDVQEPFAWRIVRRDKDGTLFLIISRRREDDGIGSETDGAIYRSDNGAASWSKLSIPEKTNGPTSLAIDEKTGRMIVSAWGRNMKQRFAEDVGGGIFISDDEGRTWKQVLEKDQHIHDITVDSVNNIYYACGFNGSAYRSTDRGETWSRIKGYNFKWGKRVVPDPRDPSKIFVVTFGGGVWYGPANGDSTAIEDIVSPVFSR